MLSIQADTLPFLWLVWHKGYVNNIPMTSFLFWLINETKLNSLQTPTMNFQTFHVGVTLHVGEIEIKFDWNHCVSSMNFHNTLYISEIVCRWVLKWLILKVVSHWHDFLEPFSKVSRKKHVNYFSLEHYAPVNKNMKSSQHNQCGMNGLDQLMHLNVFSIQMKHTRFAQST